MDDPEVVAARRAVLAGTYGVASRAQRAAERERQRLAAEAEVLRREGAARAAVLSRELSAWRDEGPDVVIVPVLRKRRTRPVHVDNVSV